MRGEQAFRELFGGGERGRVDGGGGGEERRWCGEVRERWIGCGGALARQRR